MVQVQGTCMNSNDSASEAAVSLPRSRGASLPPRGMWRCRKSQSGGPIMSQPQAAAVSQTPPWPRIQVSSQSSNSLYGAAYISDYDKYDIYELYNLIPTTGQVQYSSEKTAYTPLPYNAVRTLSDRVKLSTTIALFPLPANASEEPR